MYCIAMKIGQFILVVVISTFSYGNNNAPLLLNGNCITCHHETKSISAPSLKLIKKRYKNAFPKKKDFVQYMSQWVLKPNIQGSLMNDMIQKYSLMPELGFDKDTLEIITAYIYDENY